MTFTDFISKRFNVLGIWTIKSRNAFMHITKMMPDGRLKVSCTAALFALTTKLEHVLKANCVSLVTI